MLGSIGQAITQAGGLHNNRRAFSNRRRKDTAGSDAGGKMEIGRKRQ